MRRLIHTIMLMALTSALLGAESMMGGPDYDLSRNSIDGGGVMRSTGGDFELSGTIGQSDAARTILSGDDIELTGGFWFRVVPGDCNADSGINLFDFTQFDLCMSGPGGGLLQSQCGCFDFDEDGDIDIGDFRGFQVRFLAH